MKVYEVASLEVLDPSQLKDDVKQALLAAYDSLSQREILMLYDEVRMPDRGALDDAFLLAIGVVDADERKLLAAKIQDAACRMVWNRLAKSTLREALMGYDEWLCTGKPFGRMPYMQRRTRCKQRSISIYSVSFAIPSPCGGN